MAKEYESAGIWADEANIDAICMWMFKNPQDYSVIVAENMFGDIVSDLCAGLVGGLGVVPGANIGDTVAVFEAVHGTAPDIAGKGLANPLACIMSGVMMLNHIHDTTGNQAAHVAADKIKNAYNSVLAEGKHLTRDLGGTAGTNEFTDALIEKIK
jgi:isocitrate dehydrogenase (NAD+)